MLLYRHKKKCATTSRFTILCVGIVKRIWEWSILWNWLIHYRLQTLIFKLLRICREGWKLYRNFWNFWSEKLKIEILRAKLEAWNKVCSSCAADTFALEISQMVWYFAKVKELVQISFFVFLFRVRPLIIWLLDVFLKCTITAFLRYSIRLWSERIRPRTNIWWPRVYFKQIILTKVLQKM